MLLEAGLLVKPSWAYGYLTSVQCGAHWSPGRSAAGHIPGLQNDPGRDGATVVGLRVRQGVTESENLGVALASQTISLFLFFRLP